MKSGSPRKAPKVAPPSRKKPNFMRESSNKIKGNIFMKGKRLST